MMMRRAEERFSELPSKADVVKHTYVIAPGIRWQGILENSLCSFWGQDLSEVWAGTEIEKRKPQKQIELFPKPEFQPFAKESTKGWLAFDEERKTVFPVTPEMRRRGQGVKEHFFDKHGWVVKEDPVTKVRWLEETY